MDEKKRGFALDRNEYIPEVRAVASIINTDTHSLAAIWVVDFSSSLTDIKMQELIEKTLPTTDAISRELKRNKGA